MSGGLGNDTFVFTTAINVLTNYDTIIDFEIGVDKIQLENGIFTKLLTVGALSSNNFMSVTGTDGVLDTNDYIIYHSDTDILAYDANGSAAGSEVQIALLGTSSHPSLTCSNFWVS